jgi:TrmH family RNA methyltransferase
MEERPLLTSLSNPLVKEIRALKSHKGRNQTNLFLVEGLHHVGSVIEAGWEVDTLLYAPDLLTSDFAPSLLDDARRIGIVPQPVSAKVMESLAEKDNPQGILAAVVQRELGLDDAPVINTAAALVSPQDPGNLGTILRTVDAVGVDALFLLDGGVDLYHPTCVRASMGTLFWKPIIRTDFATFANWAKKQEMQLIGTSAHGRIDYANVNLGDAPWCLVLGNEQKGLSDEQIAACDMLVSLPMRGKVSSLNLSVAAGILLYALNA